MSFVAGYSQSKLSGVIIDEESGYPESEAFVMQENGQNVISDSTGQFSIQIAKLPVKLLVSHVAYGQSEISKDVMLPNFPGMAQITVSNNAVYFLYPEKKYPYYVRLYRYQL